MRPEHMAAVIRLGFCVMSIESAIQEDPFPLRLRDCTELINNFVDKVTY